MIRKDKLALIAIGAGVVLLVALGIIAGRSRDAGEGKVENVYVDVPDADVEAVEVSKSEAYSTYDARKSSINDYWDSCYEETMTVEEAEDGMAGRSDGTRDISSGDVSSEELFGDVQTSQGSRGRSGQSGSGAYRESAADREARHQKRREEAMELADEMYRRQNGETEGETVQEETVAEERISTGVASRPAGVVSSLDDGWTSGGVSSLDDGDEWFSSNDDHPFKCMFVKEEKIKNGQRVSIRLLEDMIIGQLVIPKNTHLSASCNIGNRLELLVSSIEMNGRIYSLGYEAYDSDGSKGIYCPSSGQAAQTVRGHGTSLIGTALGGRMGSIANQVVNTGVSLVQSASGETSVTVPSGYSFFIVKKKQNN